MTVFRFHTEKLPARKWHDALSVQMRVIGALTMRELHVRYGRKNIGFLWIIVEPMLFAGAVLAMRSFVKVGHYSGGLSVVAFLVTGYLPFIVFRNMWSQCMGCVRSNHSVLYHRHVAILDLYATRFVIELAGTALAVAVGWTTLIVLGLLEMPLDLGQVYLGLFFLAWFGAAFGMMMSVGAEYHSLFEKVTHPLTYLSIMISGCFYMVDWLPAEYQELALYVPMVHGFELIRGGFFGPQVTVHYDIGYISAVCLVCTFFGLAMLHGLRNWLPVR